jgi:hypothetical protein
MRFLTDENFDNDVLRALQKLHPAADIVRAQDVEIYQADDPAVLKWAALEERVLLTHDVKTMPRYAYEHMAAGLRMPGIVEIHRKISKSRAIDELSVMIGAGTPEDFENQVRYVSAK